jgi:dTDP-4-amino-4,6-dideoxygalactose transaminase
VGVQQGDIVFCSTLTFSATANPITYEGGVPVFVDSEEDTWNMDPIALKRAFDKYEAMGKKPKAVIFVHLYGIAAKLDEIIRICREHNCAVIEDAAESLGTTYTVKEDMAGADGQVIKKGTTKYTGTFGDYGILSFNGNKIITTSGGGMLLCNTADAKEQAKKVLYLATQAREPARWYQHTCIGYNYRMSNIVAGIGRGQLKVLDERIQKKREIFNVYKEEIGNMEGVSMMPMLEYSRCNCWLTAIRLSDAAKISPMELMDALAADDVESRPVWKPMHLQPVFAGCDFITAEDTDLHIINEENGADNSIAGRLFNEGVCLPSDTKMDEEDMSRICDVIKRL